MCLYSLYKTNTSELKTCDIKIMKSTINIYDIIRKNNLCMCICEIHKFNTLKFTELRRIYSSAGWGGVGGGGS
jgi:hypothetical protein